MSLGRKPARLNILHGSVRSGKTTNLLLLAPRRILEQAPRQGDIIITGRTAETAYRNVIRPLIRMFGSRITYSRGTHEGSIGGRSFYVFGANDEKAADKIQGLTAAYWNADELSLYPESFVKMGLNRLSLEGSFADWTMNPQGPYHHVKVDYIDREKELDARVWHFTLEDNPNLPKSYKLNLEREYRPGTLYYKRFVLGEWVLAQGTIFDFFDVNEHTFSEKLIPVSRFVAMDYGTSNATVFGLFGQNPNGKPKAWLEREYVHSGRDTGKQKTDGEYADEFVKWLGDTKITKVILDPSAASFRAELKKRGFHVVDADNDVINGIRTHMSMLQSGMFKLHVDCVSSIKSYGGYAWDEAAQNRGEDKPVKKNDHEQDTIRYGLQTEYASEFIVPDNAFQLGGL
jgi:PBSX family phage terminase large subunit